MQIKMINKYLLFTLILFYILTLISCNNTSDNRKQTNNDNDIKDNSKIVNVDELHNSISNQLKEIKGQQIAFDNLIEKNVLFCDTLKSYKNIENIFTDQQTENFINLFENPWEADKVLWNDYMRTKDTNKLAIAENIFVYMIDKYKDTKVQSYARDHLGRVLLKKNELEKALEMFESVQIQPDGSDFWYTAAKEEAAEIAYKMLNKVQDNIKRKTLCKRAESNVNDVINVTKSSSVKADMYAMLGHIYINYNYKKSFDAFKTSYDILLKNGSENDPQASIVKLYLNETREKLKQYGGEDFDYK